VDGITYWVTSWLLRGWWGREGGVDEVELRNDKNEDGGRCKQDLVEGAMINLGNPEDN